MEAVAFRQAGSVPLFSAGTPSTASEWSGKAQLCTPLRCMRHIEKIKPRGAFFPDHRLLTQVFGLAGSQPKQLCGVQMAVAENVVTANEVSIK